MKKNKRSRYSKSAATKADFFGECNNGAYVEPINDLARRITMNGSIKVSRIG